MSVSGGAGGGAAGGSDEGGVAVHGGDQPEDGLELPRVDQPVFCGGWGEGGDSGRVVMVRFTMMLIMVSIMEMT